MTCPSWWARLGVHQQTVRHRLRQVRELWGDEVDDPDRAASNRNGSSMPSGSAANRASPAPDGDRW